MIKPEDLTPEELEHLKWIREIGGKGYIRNYQIKFLHVCPKCNKAKGWRQFTECSNCGHRIEPGEYRNLERRETWFPI